MISRQQWDDLSDKEKLDYLFRQSQWANRAVEICSEAIDRLREEIRQQLGETPPKHQHGDAS